MVIGHFEKHLTKIYGGVAMSGLKETAAQVAASKTSLALTSWGAWFISSWLFDDLLYPAVIAWIGVLWGGLIMASLAVVLCWVWLKLIIASDKEWFNMKALRKIQKIIYWSAKLVKHLHIKELWVDKVEFVITFLLINMFFDPMISVLYFRYGDKAKVLSERDKKIFRWSAVVSNAYWIGRSWGLVTILRFVWKIIRAAQ